MRQPTQTRLGRQRDHLPEVRRRTNHPSQHAGSVERDDPGDRPRVRALRLATDRSDREAGVSVSPDQPRRAHYLPLPNYHELNIACRLLVAAFDWHIFLVGSCMTRRDYRDVDVRCMLDDAVFDAEFPGHAEAMATMGRLTPKHLAMNLAFSAYLEKQSRLPVDFQFQRVTDANAEFEGLRNALGYDSWYTRSATP